MIVSFHCIQSVQYAGKILGTQHKEREFDTLFIVSEKGYKGYIRVQCIENQQNIASLKACYSILYNHSALHNPVCI